MKKNWIRMILSLVLAGSMTVPAYASGPHISHTDSAPGTLSSATAEETAATYRYPIFINGQSVDAAACIMVPLRAVAEPLGFTVTWDDGGVVVDNGVIHTRVIIGVDQYCITTSNEDLVGMSAPFSLGAAPYVADGVTYVPLGLFRALLGNREDAITLEGGQILIQTEAAEIANPFITCETTTEAESIAGFSLDLPDSVPIQGEQTAIRVIPSDLIEVTYQGDGETLVVRKGVGSQDISGDYREYEWTDKIIVDSCPVTVKGADGKAAVAVWSRDGYTYAVSIAPGMEVEALSALVSGIR